MDSINIESFYKAFPTLSHKRNRFPFEKEINFDLKMGQIKPIAAIPVVPGQTYHLDLATVLRVAPLSNPPMDSATFKAFAFYQANRNTWDNYQYWFGEKKYPENPEKEPTYLVPKITAPEEGFAANGFFDNIGVVPGVPGIKIDAYLSRMDRQIYNNYFRNQSLENALEVSTGDEDDEYTADLDTLRYICRPRDFFAQALPTQSGAEAVEIPLGSSAPVIFNNSAPDTNGGNNSTVSKNSLSKIGYYNAEGNIISTGAGHHLLLDGAGNSGYYQAGDGTAQAQCFVSANADLSKAIGAPLEGLYQAIAYNTLNYITSRSGNRYFEQISNIYGCVNPDQVLRLPEFLGSVTKRIDFDTITQTSAAANEPTQLGNRAANGYMEQYNGIISKSFGEFGWIIIYGVVTYMPKYQQGVPKLMQTEDPLELFNPLFNLMGDEAIYESEVYAQAPTVLNEEGNPANDTVWGYGKRNSRILYPISEIHGEQRSSYPQSLDANHFAENYTNAPGLNKQWDKISDEGFKRALTVQDEVQFLGNALITGVQDIEIPMNPIPSPIPDVLLDQNNRM